LSFYHLQIGLFVILLLVELYLFALVFSCVDSERFGKLKLLGPIAFLIPGVLSGRGRWALVGVMLTTGCILLLSINLFDIRDLP
jgi:hypothetical protein